MGPSTEDLLDSIREQRDAIEAELRAIREAAPIAANLLETVLEEQQCADGDLSRLAELIAAADDLTPKASAPRS